MSHIGSFDDMEQGWPQLLEYVLRFGREVKPRGQATTEVTAASFTLTDPRRAIIWSGARKLNHAFGAAEFLWVISGQDDSDVLGFYNSKMLDFADQLPKRVGYPPRLFGAYGPPIVEQLPYVVDNLTRDPDSRQAVITIWRPSPPATRDVPCTVALQFLRRENKLELITTMRSNDLFLGTPYDVPLFCRVQSYVASVLGLEVGPYHHQAGSLHIYERNIEELKPALDPTGLTLGPRPEELVIGPFATAKEKPLAAFNYITWAARGLFSIIDLADGPKELGLGWSTVAGIAIEYARRKRAKETNGGA